MYFRKSKPLPVSVREKNTEARTTYVLTKRERERRGGGGGIQRLLAIDCLYKYVSRTATAQGQGSQ